MSLSRDDVILGRALLAWGLVARHDLDGCAADVRRLAAQGRAATLGQILIQRGFLSVERYQVIVARLRQQYLEAPGVSPELRQATQQVPGMNAAGRYTQTFQAPTLVNDSAVDQVAADWQFSSRRITASGSDLGTPQPPQQQQQPPPPQQQQQQQQQQQPAASPAAVAPADRAVRRQLKAPAAPAPFTVGAWLVQEYVDDGNFGIVYRVARQGGDGRAHALKLLKQFDPPEELRQRFIREARTLFKLQHPGIVRVHDAGVAGGLLWFVMDFMDGPDLGALLEERGSLGVPDALRIVRSLGAAVAYAHGQGILHRDLKPENVLMAGGREPVLTDFGLAKDEGSTMNLTQEGQRIGTPLYMAPELLLDASKANVQSEVYALGAILYQCLTGRPPYQAKSLFDLVDAIEQGGMAPVTKLCAGAPRALDALCKRALHKKPGKRPQTVAALLAELAKLG